MKRFYLLCAMLLMLSMTACESESASLAQEILDDSGITLLDYQITLGTADGATAEENIQDVANGELAQNSCYQNAPCGETELDVDMLFAMVELGDTYDYRVTSIAGGSHSPNSRHYVGVAFDVDRIDGTRVRFQTSAVKNAFLQICEDLGATEHIDENSHLHCAWPRPNRAAGQALSIADAFEKLMAANTVVGKEISQLYHAHQDELTWAVLESDELRAEAIQLGYDFDKIMRSVHGRDATAIFEAETVDAMDDFITTLAASVDPHIGDTLNRKWEKRDIAQYVGEPVVEVWSELNRTAPTAVSLTQSNTGQLIDMGLVGTFVIVSVLLTIVVIRRRGSIHS